MAAATGASLQARSTASPAIAGTPLEPLSTSTAGLLRSAEPTPTLTTAPTLATSTMSISSPASPSTAPTACPFEPAIACDAPPAPTALPTLGQLPSSQAALHVPILEYHRVKPYSGETGSAVGLVVPPETFRAQMDALQADGWRTITMGELGDDLRLGRQPPSRTFVITLDDGYEDGFTYAFPILRSHAFVATFFVIAGLIGTPDRLNQDELLDLASTGNEIGNHTMRHTDMRVMTAERLVTETYGASAVIAAYVGIWPRSFCYPMGLTYAPSTAAVAATPGMLTAVIQGGSGPETWADRLQLPRLRVTPGTYPDNLVARMRRLGS